jgi:hypothetical protein
VMDAKGAVGSLKKLVRSIVPERLRWRRDDDAAARSGASSGRPLPVGTGRRRRASGRGGNVGRGMARENVCVRTLCRVRDSRRVQMAQILARRRSQLTRLGARRERIQLTREAPCCPTRASPFLLEYW